MTLGLFGCTSHRLFIVLALGARITLAGDAAATDLSHVEALINAGDSAGARVLLNNLMQQTHEKPEVRNRLGLVC